MNNSEWANKNYYADLGSPRPLQKMRSKRLTASSPGKITQIKIQVTRPLKIDSKKRPRHMTYLVMTRNEKNTTSSKHF